MSILKGEYRWHFHENTDELFIVPEGKLMIEIRGQETIFVEPGESVKIPAKAIHKTSAIGRKVN